MRIGQAANLLGVSPDFLRSLEARGNIPLFARDMNGHRRLTDSDIAKLRVAIYGARPAAWDAAWRVPPN